LARVETPLWSYMVTLESDGPYADFFQKHREIHLVIRSAHGTAREGGATVVIETRPLDEIPTANASETAAALAMRRVRGKPFTRGNKAASGRRPALAGLGVDVPTADPAYQRALARANRYRRRRCSELAAAHGGWLSSGAAGLVASASLALAASRYLYERAGATGDTALLAQAARLADSAKGLEIAAIDIASREAAQRPRGKSIADLLAERADTALAAERARGEK
jgi:hypothetical protein